MEKLSINHCGKIENQIAKLIKKRKCSLQEVLLAEQDCEERIMQLRRDGEKEKLIEKYVELVIIKVKKKELLNNLTEGEITNQIEEYFEKYVIPYRKGCEELKKFLKKAKKDF